MSSNIKRLFLKVISAFVPIKDEIYLESKPIFSDNTYRLYLELLKRSVNEKYKIIWIYDNYDKAHDEKIPTQLPYNVAVVKIDNDTLIGRIKKQYFMARGKLYISCNLFYGGRRTEQFNLHLNHGAPFKDAGENNKINPLCTVEIALSRFLLPYTAKDSGVEEKRIIVTGFPRNDFLFETDSALVRKNKMLQNFDKIIVWMPTFRQSWHKGRRDNESNFAFGVPIIKTMEDFYKLNNALKKNNTVLIAKIHFAQDMSYVKEQRLSNIFFWTNDDLKEMNLQLNEFLAGTDALITDYSSVYFDYLLLNKPIGLTVDDIDVYLKSPGIVYESYFDAIKGFYIHNLDEMINFIDHELYRTDICNQQSDVVKRYNDFYDGKSSARILEYLEKNNILQF